MAKQKEYWQVMIDNDLEQKFNYWSFWYEKQFNKKPSKTEFIKTSLEIFKQIEPKIKRKKRSRKLQCM